MSARLEPNCEPSVLALPVLFVNFAGPITYLVWVGERRSRSRAIRWENGLSAEPWTVRAAQDCLRDFGHPRTVTVVPSGQAIAGGSSGADGDTVPRVVERLAALVGVLRLPARSRV